MSAQQILINYQADTEELDNAIELLEKTGQIDKKTADQFRKANQVYKERAKTLEKTTTAQKKSNQEIRKGSKDVGELSKAVNDFQKLAKKGVALLGLSFAGREVIQVIKGIDRLGIQIEGTENKFNTVFGEAGEVLRDFAKTSAASLGLSESEFLKATASAGDLLVPLEFARKEAALMSKDLVSLSGALSAWTAGEISSIEVTEILTKALLGEREQLKRLGINIQEADVKARLAEKGQEKLTGAYLKQAKAVATLELITEKSADAQAAFNDEITTLAEGRLEVRGIFRQIGDSIARFFIPTITAAQNGLLKFIRPLVDTRTEAEKFADEFKESNEVLTRNESKIKKLLPRYDELKDKGELNNEEQAELQGIINDLVEIVPSAATGFNEYGEALDINRGSVEDFIDKQRELNLLLNEKAIRKVREEVERLRRKFNQNATAIEKNNRAAFELSDNINEELNASSEIIDEIAESSRDYGEANKELNVEIARNLLLLESMGVELSEADQAFINATLAVDDFTGSGGPGGGGVKAAAGSIKDLTDKLKKLKTELATASPDDETYIKLLEEMIALEEQVEKLETRLDKLRTSIEGSRETIQIDVDDPRTIGEIIGDTYDAIQDKSEETKRKLIGDSRLVGLENARRIRERLNFERDAAVSTIELFRRNAGTALVVAGEFTNTMNAFSAARLARIQADLDAGVISEKQAARERAKVARAEAIFNKISAGVEVALNTAIAISKAIGKPRAIAEAIIVGALQAAAVAAQPIPSIPNFRLGTKSAPPGTILVGEDGPELLHNKQGASIIPNEDTRKILSSWDVPTLPASPKVRTFGLPGLSQRQLTQIHANAGRDMIDYDRLSDAVTRTFTERLGLLIRTEEEGYEYVGKSISKTNRILSLMSRTKDAYQSRV